MKRSFLFASMFAVGLAAWACSSDAKSAGDTSKAASASTPGGAVDPPERARRFRIRFTQKWFQEYTAKTNVYISYQPLIRRRRRALEQTVDFGASDAPMAAILRKAKGSAGFSHSTVVGVVAIAYNVRRRRAARRSRAGSRAGIFLARSPSGTTSDLRSEHRVCFRRRYGTVAKAAVPTFTDYLSAVLAWKGGPGKGKEIQWPVGLGAKGNDGVPRK